MWNRTKYIFPSERFEVVEYSGPESLEHRTLPLTILCILEITHFTFALYSKEYEECLP